MKRQIIKKKKKPFRDKKPKGIKQDGKNRLWSPMSDGVHTELNCLFSDFRPVFPIYPLHSLSVNLDRIRSPHLFSVAALSLTKKKERQMRRLVLS